MDDQRKDAPEFDLSARSSDADDALQLDPSDLVETPPEPPAPRAEQASPKPAGTSLDAQLFNALVSPVAPVALTANKPAEPPAAPVVSISDVASDDALAPIKMVQPEPPASAEESAADWEPLPPLMRIASDSLPDVGMPNAGVFSQAEIPAEPGFAEPLRIKSEPEIEVQLEPEPSPRTVWDPAAIDAPDEVEAEAETIPPPVEAEETPAIDPAAFMASPLVMKAKASAVPAMPAEPADSTPGIGAPVEPPPMPRGPTGAWWTIPMMCVGLAILACAVLVPAADDNRRAVHELAKLERDVAYFERQSEVNKQFLEHVSTDPTLAERLALRQLRLTRAASKVVELPRADDAFSMSPYALVTIDPPAPMPEYRPLGGFISAYFLDTKGQIYLAGLGILLTAAGVILGGGVPGKMETSNVE